MLTHGEFEGRFSNRSGKELSSDIYFGLFSSYGFLFMKNLKKKLSQYPKIECTPPPLNVTNPDPVRTLGEVGAFLIICVSDLKNHRD